MASGELLIEEKIPEKGSDRPAMKYLNRHVAVEIACKWYDVGIELMNTEDEQLLNTMRAQYGSNSIEGSKEMLREWLQRKPDASWIQLIAALKISSIGLNERARNLERLLSIESCDIEKSQPQSNKQKADEAPNAIADDDDIDFSEYEDVVVAFTSLMTRLHKKVTASQLQFIKARCLAVTHDRVFRECIKNEADSVDNFFSLLSEHTLYCNWLNIRLVEVIATASGNKKLEDLVSNYRTEIYSRKLQQVLEYIPQHKVKNKYYKEVTKRISKNPDNVTVRELIKYDRPLANKIALILMSVTANCVSITWLVPTDKVYELFLFALTIPQQSREDDFLKIGSWIVYHPQSVLQELKKTFAMASPLTLLIGYYHGLLSRDINAGLLIEEMYSKKLLNTESDHHIIVSTGHSVYQKNLLLLEYVRHMDAKSFLEFCKVIMNLWPEIGAQIVAVTDHDTMKLQSDTTQDVTTEVQVVGQYYDPSLVHIAFLCLIDQVSKLLQSCDIKKLIERCEVIMACEEENIKLFSDDQLKRMNECCSLLSLLLSLKLFSWSNHSILRELLVECGAVRLLDEFDSRLDPLQSIASYPIPYFLSNMIPDDTNTYTILAIRCDRALYECTLQYVYDMQSVMVKTCDITQHCLQLLAVRSDPTMLYWTIPQCVVDLINKEVPQHSKYLRSKGVLEVHIYTKPLLTTDNDVIGTLVFVADSNRNAREAVDVKQPTKEFDQPEAPNIKQRIKAKLLTDHEKLKVKVNQLTEECDKARSELSNRNQEIQSLNQRLLEIENNPVKRTTRLLSPYPEPQTMNSESKVQNDEDSPNDQDDLTELEHEVHEFENINPFSGLVLPSAKPDMLPGTEGQFPDVFVEYTCKPDVWPLHQYTENPMRYNVGKLSKRSMNNVYYSLDEAFAFKEEMSKVLLIEKEEIFKKITTLNPNTFVPIIAYLKCMDDQRQKFGYQMMEYYKDGSTHDLFKVNVNGVNCTCFIEIYHQKHEEYAKIKKCRDSFRRPYMFSAPQEYQYELEALNKKISLLSNELENLMRNFTAVIVQILKTVECLHFNGLVHRDIKPHNFLVKRMKSCHCQPLIFCSCEQPGFRILLGDYDYVSLATNQKWDFTKTKFDYSEKRIKRGTLGYRPLELNFDNEGDEICDPKSDIYSLGVSIMEILSGSNWETCKTEIDEILKICMSPLSDKCEKSTDSQHDLPETFLALQEKNTRLQSQGTVIKELSETIKIIASMCTEESYANIIHTVKQFKYIAIEKDDGIQNVLKTVIKAKHVDGRCAIHSWKVVESKWICNIIQHCVKAHPQKRPCIQELLKIT